MSVIMIMLMIWLKLMTMIMSILMLGRVIIIRNGDQMLSVLHIIASMVKCKLMLQIDGTV